MKLRRTISDGYYIVIPRVDLNFIKKDKIVVELINVIEDQTNCVRIIGNEKAYSLSDITIIKEVSLSY